MYDFGCTDGAGGAVVFLDREGVPTEWKAVAPKARTAIRATATWGYTNDSDYSDQLSRRRDDVRATDGHLRFVARHRVRVVRLLHLRHARRVPGEILLLQRAAQRRLHLRAACLRGGLCGPAVRRAD